MFHDNLKAARLRAGYSRKYMADLLGVSSNTYRLYETDVEPRIAGLIKIAQILHVSIDSLLDNVPDEYQRYRNKFMGESVEFVDLDDGRIRVSVHHASLTQTLIMSKDEFVDLARHAELRDGRELLQQFFRLFTDSYAHAADSRFHDAVKAEPLEYINMP